MPAMDKQKDTVICDLDGTIALDHHRNHHLHPPHKEGCEFDKTKDPNTSEWRPCTCGWKRDWTSYFAECHTDEPNWSVIDTLRLFWEDGYNIRILTGRNVDVKDATEKWLRQHAVPYHTLRMREANDRTDDHILKPQWAEASGYFPSNTLIVFEDRDRVVKAWRALGYNVFQVAPGNF